MGNNNFSAMQFAFANNLTSKAMAVLGSSTQRIISPIKASLMDYVKNNICCYHNITGHYDSYISKSMVSVLETKYLSKKYGTTLIDVDPSFALCTASIERVKKKVTCFPELVNKTIAPGIYSLVMDSDGTRMVVLKEPVLSKDDRSDNGIISNIVHFSTSVFFFGKNRVKWYKKVMKEIDDVVSAISKTNQDNNRIKYNTMGSNGDEMKELQVRPMGLLTFPAKEYLLSEIQDFRNKEKIYTEFSVPYRKGILLSGKPGTGKTAFAFSIAQYFEMECVSVNLDVFDKQDGDAKFGNSNTVYVIDEIDSQLVNRAESSHETIQKSLTTSRRLLQLLRAMDSMNGGSIVVATTNYPERLDPALKRSGRFDIICEMDDLSKEYAYEMVKNRGCDPEEVLKDKAFPINPAYLEQLVIENILVTNNIGQKEVASFSELGLDNEELSNPIDDDDDDLIPCKNDYVPKPEDVIASDEPHNYKEDDDDDDDDEDDD